MHKKFIYSILIIAIVVVAGAVVFKYSLQQQQVSRLETIKQQIQQARYCDTKADCVPVDSKCPFGCYLYVNQDHAEQVQQLIDSYDSQCVYGCVQSAGFDCIDNECQALH